jgi:SH3 domain protein
MERWLLIILVLLFVFPSATQAEEMYIVDYFKIMVRRQPGEEYKIIEQLPSNEKVRLIKTEGDWAKISSGNGRTGWVLKRYLTEELPKTIQMAKLERKIKNQAKKIEALEKENMSIKQKNVEILQSIATQSEKVKNVSLENQRLKEEPYRIMLLLSGGGIFLIGCIITLIIQRLGRGRKSRLSFEKGIKP